jgi:hypothetical protein
MANQNILTTLYRTTQTQQDFYSPVSVLPGTTQTIESIYCFLSRVDPWPDDADPPAPTQTQQYLKSVYANIFAAKQITANDIALVIQRIDWKSGNTYDYYQDTVDMFALDTNGYLVLNFYVRNRYNQVFKCLWNNNGQPSTYEPFFQPGTYGTDGIYQNVDGYKWKYMYTIDPGSKRSFMDTNWMPVPIDLVQGEAYSGQTLDPTETSAGYGDVEVVNVLSGGSGYDPANNIISVSIVGDGYGANAAAVVANGSITDIVVSNPGYNYTYANVVITSASGGGAVAIAPISPIGGHAYDPPSELGCTHTMFVCEFNGSESVSDVTMVPTDIEYRQVGIVYNPLAHSSYPYFANAAIYNCTTQFTVAPGFGAYISDEMINQVDPQTKEIVFTATVLDFNTSTNVLYLINTKGTPILNGPVYGNTATRTLLTTSNPDYINFSGYIAYIENRSGVQRSVDGIEQFKFVLGY